MASKSFKSSSQNSSSKATNNHAAHDDAGSSSIADAIKPQNTQQADGATYVNDYLAASRSISSEKDNNGSAQANSHNDDIAKHASTDPTGAQNLSPPDDTATQDNSTSNQSNSAHPIVPLTPPLPTPVIPVVPPSTASDTTVPQLVLASSLDYQAKLLPTDNLQLQFNENIQLGSGNIELHNAADNSVVESFKNGVGSAGGYLTISKAQLSINPAADLKADTQYYLTLSDGVIQDLAGNKLPAISAPDAVSFTTAGPDTQAPVLMPLANQMTNGLMGQVALTFNEGVQLGNGRIEVHNASDNSLVEAFSTNTSAAVMPWTSGSKLNIPFSKDMLPSTQYYVTLSPDAVTDSAGNHFEGTSDSKAFVFSTGNTVIFDPNAPDTFAPEINGTWLSYPMTNSSDVLLNFNEEVKLGNGDIVLHAADGSVLETFHNGVGSSGGTVAANFSTLDINPGADLAPDSKYYLTMTPGVITDKVGNAFAADTHQSGLAFSGPITDHQVPNFLNSFANPSGLPVGTLKATQMMLNFDEAVKLGAGSIVLHNADGSVVETFANGMGTADGYISQSNTSLILTTYANLQTGASYYVTIAGNAVTDTAGNAFAGITDPTVAKFVQQPSATYPDVSNTALALNGSMDNQIGIFVATDISLSFNNNVVLGGGTMTLHNADDGSIVETFTHGVGSSGGVVTTSKAGVTINPAADLIPATQYYLTMDNSAIASSSGEAFPGIADASTMNFFTAGADKLAPHLTGSNAGLGSYQAVAPDAPISLFFDEPVKMGSGAIELRKVADNSLVESFAQNAGSAGGSLTVNNTQLTLTPGTKLDLTTKYYLTIADNAITDSFGNALPAITSPTTVQFTTMGADVQGPQYYGANLQNLPLSDNLVLNFDENLVLGNGTIQLHNALDGSVVESFTHGVGSAGGTATVENAHVITGSKGATHSLVINPAADLAAETQYYLTLDNHALTDTSGNAFAEVTDSGTISFNSYSAGPMNYGVSQNSYSTAGDLMLGFSSAVQLGAGNIVLHKAADDSVVETFVNGVGSAGGTVSALQNNIEINPAANLAPNTQYYLTVSKGAITDTAGVAYAGNVTKTSLAFTSGPVDTLAPELTSSTPLDNQTYIDPHADLNLWFNEAVQLGLGNIVLHNADGSVVESFAHGVGSAGGTISAPSFYGNSMLDINPGLDLQLGTNYYLTLANNAVMDVSGNAYSGLVDLNGLNFKTTSDLGLISNNTPYPYSTAIEDMHPLPIPTPMQDGGIDLVGVQQDAPLIF